MPQTIRRTALTMLALVACVGISACGSSSDSGGGGSTSTAAGGSSTAASSTSTAAGSTSASNAAPKWKATLRLDYTLQGFTVPEVVAEQKGFYRKHGLDLEVQEGSGSGVTTQQTGTGVSTFGEADVSTAALYIAKGIPLKSVAVFLQKTPNGLAYNSDKVTLDKPSDLDGKTLGLVQGEAPYWLLLAASAKNNISTDSFNKVFMSPSALPGALLGGRVDAMGSFEVGSFETLKLKNPSIKFTSFSNWGVSVLGNGLLAPVDMIENNPDEVQAFVDGTVEGWKWSLAHPHEAAAIAAKKFPSADATALEHGLLDSKAYLHTSETEGLPLGATTEAQWQQTIDFDKQYAGLKSDMPVSDYYTNQFVSKGG